MIFLFCWSSSVVLFYYICIFTIVSHSSYSNQSHQSLVNLLSLPFFSPSICCFAVSDLKLLSFAFEKCLKAFCHFIDSKTRETTGNDGRTELGNDKKFETCISQLSTTHCQLDICFKHHDPVVLLIKTHNPCK